MRCLLGCDPDDQLTIGGLRRSLTGCGTPIAYPLDPFFIGYWQFQFRCAPRYRVGSPIRDLAALWHVGQI